jgi:hypothetical protein
LITTRIVAAFFDGAGPTARFLGSLGDRVDPLAILAVPSGRRALTATDPISYAVADLLDLWVDDQPDTTAGTDEALAEKLTWIYAFHGGRTQITIALGDLPGVHDADASPPTAAVLRLDDGHGPLGVHTNELGDVRCVRCGAVNTQDGETFASYGGTTEWWQRCTACGQCNSGANLSAVR